MAEDTREKDTLSYTAEDIQVLEGLEAVRRRPGMYIGGTDSRALHHMVYEVVDNAVDEALAGFCDRIEITIHPDNSVTVEDNGRGIPVDIHPQVKRPALEVVMTRLHAGGKFGGGGYKVSGGLHGVGVSAVNALSKWLEVVVKRDGKIWRQRYEQGRPVTDVEVIGKMKKGERTGTRVTFLRDPEIFEVLEYRFDILAQRFREIAFLTRGLHIKFVDERPSPPKEINFYFEGGIATFVRYLNKTRKPLHDPVYVEKQVNEVLVEAAIQYTAEYVESVYAFANTINTPDGGTHLTGLRSAITRTLNDYARKHGLLKDDEPNFTGEDTREGLTAIVSVKLPDPQFESQTKVKLLNAEVRNIVESVVSETFGEWLETHPREAKQIIEKCKTSYRARLAARKARDLVIRKSALESMTLPGKLADCSERDPEKTELFIVEGDSAGGSAKQGRDRRFQAILPLRGKILNVEKARLDKALSNKEIQALITALGTGIGDDFDISKLRYNRIIIMSVDHAEPTFVRDRRGNIRFVRVGEFIDDVLENTQDLDGHEVLCFDLETGNVRFKPIRKVIRHPISEPLYEITTAYGRRIRVTASHSVFVYEDGAVRLKRGDEVRPGDLLVAPRRVPLAGGAHVHRLDLLAEFLARPESGDVEIYVRGSALEPFLKERIRREHADNLQLVEQRVHIPEALRRTLAERRRALGISQSEVLEGVGIKQPVTFYGWEKGTSRPTVTHFRRYVTLLGLDPDDVLGQVEVVDSALDRVWNTAYRNSGRNRVKDYMALSEMREDPEIALSILGDAEVELTPQHYATHGVPRFLPVDERLMFVLGFFLADGSISQRNGVRFAIGRNNEHILGELTDALRALFRVEPRYYPGRDGRAGEVKVVNAVVAAVFRHIFGFDGARAHTKRVPDIVFNVSPELQLAFLRGYFLGDGTVSTTGIHVTTVSETLAGQLLYLLSAHHVLASHSVREPAAEHVGHVRGKPVITRHPVHTITVQAKDDLRRLRRVWQDHPRAGRLEAKLARERTHRGPRAFVEIGGDLVGLPVRTVRQVEPTNSMVYDFSVDTDENFICGLGGLAAHNTDADVDGAHIRTLLLTFFFRYMPQLIEEGHLYIAQPPLYLIKAGKQHFYAYSEEEKEKILKRLDGSKVTIQRYKGLGEMNPEQLWETTMNPDNRILLQVTVNDAAEADRTFGMLMGDQVPPRRRFILTHAKAVRNLDV